MPQRCFRDSGAAGNFPSFAEVHRPRSRSAPVSYLTPQLLARWRVHTYVVVLWRVLVAAYVAAAVAALVIVNADQGEAPAAAGLVAAMAFALGWGTASGWGAVAAWLVVPLALPFGQANQFSGSHGTDPVVLLAAISAAMSTLVILAAGGARVLYNRLLSKGQGVRTAAGAAQPSHPASQPNQTITPGSLDPTNGVEPLPEEASRVDEPTPAPRA
jgi:hypothetical protein